MAVTPLNLTPQLQPWHDAGLNCLLLEVPLADWLAGLSASAPVPSVVSSSPSAAAQPDALPHDITPVATLPSGDFSPDQPRPEKQSSSPSDKLPASLTEKRSSSLNVQDLPEPWQQVLSKVRSAPIAWIYPELGQDLLLQADAGRGQALRGIIAALQLKKGSSTFWPTALPALLPVSGALDTPDSKLVSGHELFRFGLEHLGVKFLVAFGPQALADTAYGHLQLRPFSEQIAEGRLILALPDFAEILSGQARLDSITQFLRAVFSRYFVE